MGIITENFAGAFPLWLTPVQVAILNITDNSLPYAKEVKEKLQAAGFRVELDERNEKIGKKIREAQLQKIPYMLVIGDNEARDKKIAVRSRKAGDLGAKDLDEFIAQIKVENDNKSL